MYLLQSNCMLNLYSSSVLCPFHTTQHRSADLIECFAVRAAMDTMCLHFCIVTMLSVYIITILHATANMSIIIQGKQSYEVAGIITLEDIIEEVLGDDIQDETDTFKHVNSSTHVHTALAKKGHQLSHKGRRPSSFLDMSRLQLLNTDAQQCTLAKGEAKAVAAYLCANVEPFSRLSRDRVKAIVQASSAVNLKRTQADSVSTEDILYKRGKVTTTCTLVLSGRLTVSAGKDGFESELGPWSVLATDALTVIEGQYHPDFSAHIGSESVRIMRISCSAYNGSETSSTQSTNSSDSGITPPLSPDNNSNSDVFDNSSSPLHSAQQQQPQQQHRRLSSSEARYDALQVELPSLSVMHNNGKVQTML
jgi:hypothetical protein